MRAQHIYDPSQKPRMKTCDMSTDDSFRGIEGECHVLMLNPLQAPFQEAQVTMDELVHCNHHHPPTTTTRPRPTNTHTLFKNKCK